MPKLYHSVPLDEEKDGASFQAASRTLSTDSERDGVVPRARRKLGSHWPWLIHAVLLTISGTLFAVSFCARTAKPDDTLYTKLYSSYCEFLLLIPDLWHSRE